MAGGGGCAEVLRVRRGRTGCGGLGCSEACSGPMSATTAASIWWSFGLVAGASASVAARDGHREFIAGSGGSHACPVESVVDVWGEHPQQGRQLVLVRTLMPMALVTSSSLTLEVDALSTASTGGRDVGCFGGAWLGRR